MTIFISSSAKRPLATMIAAFTLLTGCGPAGQATNGDADAQAAGTDNTLAPATAVARTATAATPAAQDVAALYTADLARAVGGAKKVAFLSAASFGGMTCSPATINVQARALTLTLPEDAAARHHVLAVVTPERGLLEIYSPYGDDAEIDDLTVPSRTISWARARTERQFATTTDDLDGLRPGRTTPEALFIEPGRYRFALVNGIDAELLKANEQQVVAYAGCSFDWTP